MSYILDALKRADAERERGAAPGLHTRHQVPAGSQGAAHTRRNIGLLLAGGLVLVLLAIVFWFVRAPETPTVTLSAPPVVAPPPATAPAATVVAVVPPAVMMPVAPEAKPLIPPTAVAAKPLTAAPATAAPAAKPASQAATPAPTAASAPAQKPTPAVVALLAELSQDLRGQIPKITITGSVYSDSPAQRLLLVNNLVLAQGSQVGPDLMLEEIQPRSSVFSFKGTRFRVMH